MYDDFPVERVAKEIRNTIADLNALFQVANKKGIRIAITGPGIEFTQAIQLTIGQIKLVKDL